MFALFTLALISGLALSSPTDLASHYGHEDRTGAVASLSKECSQIGVDLLRKGGNAADAAVGVQFCVGVIGMYLTGIGGGGFALVRSANGSYEFIDFRETAPAASFEDMYNNNKEASLTGGLASGVPGEVRGLQYLHQSYGKLLWADLVWPAVKLARHGFRVNQELVNQMNWLGDDALFTDNPAWAIDFAPNGTRLALGDIMTRRRYADLLQAIADQGPDSFYNGAIAKTTVAALRAANGTMTLEDLKNYTLITRQPAQITYRDFRITSCSAPSGGIVALNALKTLEGYPDVGDRSLINDTTHRLDEAFRFAYGLRAYIGDPNFVGGMDSYQQQMLDDQTAAEIRSQISDLHTLPVSAYDPEGLESIETPGTSHVSTADATGLAISLTSTINTGFGSKIMVPETGLILNNEMNDFSIPNSTDAYGYVASPANYVKAGKRPLSSMTPVIVEYLANQTLYFVVGGAGGSRIITAVTQILWHVLDQRKTTAQALAAPRFHDQLIPNQLLVEDEFDKKIMASMAERGHNISWDEYGSDVHAVKRLPNGTFEAVGEPRQANSGGFAV